MSFSKSHPPTSIRSAFKNESGAIDLASIMVGVIVIGLIGGVVASTVFAVIPWAQDKAAKQQLDSISTAQSAHAGFTASDGAWQFGTVNVEPMTNLAGDSLMGANPERYCSLTTNVGENYVSYSKSATGKLFMATRTMGDKAEDTTWSGTGELPCLNSGAIEVITAWDCSKNVMGYGIYSESIVNCAWAQGANWNDSYPNPTDNSYANCYAVAGGGGTPSPNAWTVPAMNEDEKRGFADLCSTNGWNDYMNDVYASFELGYTGVYSGDPNFAPVYV